MYKRICPFVRLHGDNKAAGELTVYLQAGGWVQAIAVEMLKQEILDDSVLGTRLFRRVLGAIADGEYQAARQEKENFEKATSGTKQPRTNRVRR